MNHNLVSTKNVFSVSVDNFCFMINTENVLKILPYLSTFFSSPDKTPSSKLCSDGSNAILSNIDRTRTSFFEHRTNSNVFIYW